ncbi:hypothetical protein DVDV_4230 [Desulfovibrio sp. DV]|nr:hypothetical protein DVDV_4230 [Desulfovibrio sp. DV]
MNAHVRSPLARVCPGNSQIGRQAQWRFTSQPGRARVGDGFH